MPGVLTTREEKNDKDESKREIELSRYSPYVGDVGRDVILGAWIEVVLGSQDRRFRARVLLLQSVPMAIVLLPVDVAAEDVPSPSVHRDAQRQQHQLVHRQREEVVDVRGALVDVLVRQAESLEVMRSRDAQSDGFADRLVESCNNVWWRRFCGLA